MTEQTTTTPRRDGLFVPARTSEHERTLISWPARAELWGEHADEARAEYAACTLAIAEHEPVTLIVNPGSTDQVGPAAAEGVTVVEIPIDDSWIRDNGPIFLSDGEGGVAMAHFGFNAWGGKYEPYDRDAAVPRELASLLGVRRYASSMVLEGGGFSVDGEGTLLTTEEVSLNPNRNPGMSREQIEAEMREFLGVEKVIWLPHGLVEDTDTDGHSDNVVQFVRPGVVVAQVAPDRSNPNWDRLRENLEVLRSSTDAAGRRLEVIEMPWLPYTEVIEGRSYVVPYTNFYPVNGAVIAPQLSAPGEEEAFALLAEALPDRRVVGCPSRILAYGGGGIGCITQQVPAGEPLGEDR